MMKVLLKVSSSVFNSRLNATVSVKASSSLGSRFQTRGATTEKAQLLSFSLNRWMTRSLLLAEWLEALFINIQIYNSLD